MKKTVLMMFAAGVLALTSCSDDDNNNQQGVSATIGVYRIAAWNAPAAQDLDGDGISSVDLVTEFDCFANWEIVLNEDHTYTRTFSVPDAVDGELTCQTGQTSTGTWTRNGNTLVLTNAIGEGEIETSYTFSSNNEILTQTGPGQFPTIFEEIFVMESGTVTAVYTKVAAD